MNENNDPQFLELIMLYEDLCNVEPYESILILDLIFRYVKSFQKNLKLI